MPKASKYPKLRVHTKRGKAGQVWVSYWYDMRGTGKPDVALGSDRTEALRRWHEIHFDAPRIAGTLEEAFREWEEKALPGYRSEETKRGYAKNLRTMRPVFGPARWSDVTLPALRQYLDKRTAKTQGNREIALLQVIWNWSRVRGLTDLQWPAAGMERSKWKNEEKPRDFDMRPELFAAVYEHADQVLRDCMDIATATAMRLTDCRTVLMPTGDILRLKASKTGKKADFDLSLSAVLPGMLERRRGYRCTHLMLLSTPTGRPVSQSMLRDRWDAARAAAAEDEKNAHIADELKRMYLRDMRRMPANMAESDAQASELLQHSNVATTKRHYRSTVTRLKPAR